jgi:hypothetical protein
VVQQVAPATSNPELRNTVLLWTAKRSAGGLASHLPHSRNHIGAKLCVSVEEQESVRLLVAHASRSCCPTQSAWGFRVTLKLCHRLAPD